LWNQENRILLVHTYGGEALAAACPQNVYAIKARDTAAGDIDKITPFKDMPVKNIWTHELETLMVEDS